jgi:hypothetical protein
LKLFEAVICYLLGGDSTSIDLPGNWYLTC